MLTSLSVKTKRTEGYYPFDAEAKQRFETLDGGGGRSCARWDSSPPECSGVSRLVRYLFCRPPSTNRASIFRGQTATVPSDWSEVLVQCRTGWGRSECAKHQEYIGLEMCLGWDGRPNLIALTAHKRLIHYDIGCIRYATCVKYFGVKSFRMVDFYSGIHSHIGLCAQWATPRNILPTVCATSVDPQRWHHDYAQALAKNEFTTAAVAFHEVALRHRDERILLKKTTIYYYCCITSRRWLL